MRLVWELMRTLWVVGCIPVGALLLVVMVLCGFNLPFFLGISGGADPVVRWLFWALVMYFVGGCWLFRWLGQRYASKLKHLAAELQAQVDAPLTPCNLKHALKQRELAFDCVALANLQALVAVASEVGRGEGGDNAAGQGVPFEGFGALDF
ncbi:hypothetical protein [Pseudomonas sp. UBA7530]|uniref:hypothetical protein n=1 Tax=Pseudomonas sp. UBA7530 TaxID=1947341 RepID=UPI0025D02CC7|nr:hypothetical protein [Pseudomonas sp. UBA7530]